MRVQMAAKWLPNVACGGARPKSLDATEERYDQARWASVDLIRERGIAEAISLQDPPLTDATCRRNAAPSYDEWTALTGTWADETARAAASKRVVATHASTAACLRAQSRLPVDTSDPTVSYLLAVDAALSGMPSPEFATSMQRFSTTYANCTKRYFLAMEVELLPQRRRLARENRYVLERFASELQSLGYSP